MQKVSIDDDQFVILVQQNKKIFIKIQNRLKEQKHVLPLLDKLKVSISYLFKTILRTEITCN